MRRIVAVSVLALSLAGGAFLLAPVASPSDGGTCCPPPVAVKKDRDAVRAHVRAVSVTVLTGGDGTWSAHGSGTLFVSKGRCYCLTAAHVIPPDTKFVLLMQFHQDATGETNGKAVYGYAEVIANDPCQDLCLLHVGMGLWQTGAVAHDAKLPPGADTPILHCGSYQGQLHHSIAVGEIQWIGDKRGEQLWDRFDATLYGGSSGGGVFLHDGQYIGLVTHATGERVGHFVPIRHIRWWLEQRKVGSLLGCK